MLTQSFNLRRRSAAARRRITLIGATGLLLVVGAVTGCSASGATATPSDGSGQTITVYNAQHEQTTDAMIAAFTKATGINVRVVNDDEDVLTAQIEQEGSRSPADVFYTENSNWLQQLANRGMLAKVDASSLANVPAADSAADGDWAGVSARISAIVYNPAKISAAQLPKSILDMANPKYKGEFEIAPSETDFWPLVASVAKAKGDAAALAWLESLKANASDDNVPDNETLTSDVSQGVTDFAVINHYYYYRLQADRRGRHGRCQARLLRAGRSRLRQGHLGRRDPEVEQAPGRRAGIRQLPHERGGPGGARVAA